MEEVKGVCKRVFIPGYSGCVTRMNETMAGTFAASVRKAHHLINKGNHPAMTKPSLVNPDLYYPRRPNPRLQTNVNNRSTFTLGDDRDWDFDTIHSTHFSNPVKIPPRRESIIPGGRNAASITKAELDKHYTAAFARVGLQGVKRLELSIRAKIDQRTTGGPMALRKAFKYFDTDGSGDINPDEFFSAMHQFGLEFTEDQVLALFGHYDGNRDGGLSYYEFIEKVMDSGLGSTPAFGEPRLPSDLPVECKSVLTKEDLNEEAFRKVFKKFDGNASGEMDIRELGIFIKAMGLNMQQEEINNAMIDLDANCNGALSFEELWAWFKDAALVGGKLRIKSTSSVKKGNPGSTPKLQLSGKTSVPYPMDQNRPQSAHPSTTRGKIGCWVNHEGTAPLQATPFRPQMMQEEGRIRPSTAMARTNSNYTSDNMYNSVVPSPHFQSDPYLTASEWLSCNTSDFRSPSTKIKAPRLDLPSQAQYRSRPASAQPLLRRPGDVQSPGMSSSGFKL